MLNKQQKEKIIKKYKIHKEDTGSPEIQIAILTEEIRQLTDHLKTHKKDHSSRRGLLGKVSQRKKLLNYLQKEDEKRYKDIITKLKIA